MQTVLGTNCNIYRKYILNYLFEGLKSIKLINDLTFYTKSKTIIDTFPQDYQCHVGHFFYTRYPLLGLFLVSMQKILYLFIPKFNKHLEAFLFDMFCSLATSVVL